MGETNTNDSENETGQGSKDIKYKKPSSSIESIEKEIGSLKTSLQQIQEVLGILTQAQNSRRLSILEHDLSQTHSKLTTLGERVEKVHDQLNKLNGLAEKTKEQEKNLTNQAKEITDINLKLPSIQENLEGFFKKFFDMSSIYLIVSLVFVGFLLVLQKVLEGTVIFVSSSLVFTVAYLALVLFNSRR